MRLTIHWSKCDAPLTQIVRDVLWVSCDANGLRYETRPGQFDIDATFVDIALAEGWEIKL